MIAVPYTRIPSFFSQKNIKNIQQEAATVCCWDFNCALGNTLHEKYESLYIKVVELTNVLIAKGAKGYFWVIMSPEVSSMFEATHLEWTTDQIEIGVEEVIELGIINKRWRMYVTPWLSHQESHHVLVGCGLENLPEMRQVGRINVTNYII
jgi:hypothetical protein